MTNRADTLNVTTARRTSYRLPEFTRRGLIESAVARGLFVIATNSDGDAGRRNLLLGLLGPGSSERILDPGISVVTERLSRDGVLSRQCGEAVQRWYQRIANG